jgi:sarcosine oxidase subunit gamma
MIQKGVKLVVELVAISPAEGLLPYSKGMVELFEIALDTVTSIAPFKGQEGAVEKALGMTLPKVGRSSSSTKQEIAWFSQGQFLAFRIENAQGLQGIAAITDQSDAWCALELKGDAALNVLARLVPVDLRPSSFKQGHCLRSQLGHMPLHITRMGNDAFRLLSFRSMAGTMVHEISRTMDLLAARE